MTKYQLARQAFHVVLIAVSYTNIKKILQLSNGIERVERGVNVKLSFRFIVVWNIGGFQPL